MVSSDMVPRSPLHDSPGMLTRAQLRAEIERCEFCEEKPCKEACPADCSPADFIMAMRVGRPSDLARSAGMILAANPLGGVCGVVCPEKHCMDACARRALDRPIEIPPVQATIVQMAKEAGVLPAFERAAPNGHRVAILGAGPAGLAATALLAQLGCEIELIEAAPAPGGMCRLIPPQRLDPRVLETDIDFIRSLGSITIRTDFAVAIPAELLGRDPAPQAVLVATGSDRPIPLGIPGEEHAIPGIDYLRSPAAHPLAGRRVAVIGGGAVAADCAFTARLAGAHLVEMFALESAGEMPLPEREMRALLEHRIHLSGRTRVTEILTRPGHDRPVHGIRVARVTLPPGEPFRPDAVRDLPGTEQTLAHFDAVLTAIGTRPCHLPDGTPGVFFACDPSTPPTSVVEAVACGKNAALEIHAFLAASPEPPAIQERRKSRVLLRGHRPAPASLETRFFDRTISSPFLLSAAPPTDGYLPMKRAYEAGWAGGILKTAFDNVPIHIPSEYMFALGPSTYANCDNVSGHPLDRVCLELERLRREFPDRLTMASTGGPVTGDDETDRRVWQSNTRKLESAGAMGIEYSLSCPQGGDGTRGDIVAQDPELTTRVVEWVLETADPSVPKLFKLTGAVTAIRPILDAVRAVFERHPGHGTGITLANTFPSLAFRPAAGRPWDEGIVVGMSGEGVLPISNLTLARASGLGLAVSGNGGPMDYRAAANFLALGARTVQFCTIVMKYGYGILDDLHSGLSHLMRERGIRTVEELIGCALPDPITDFAHLPATKKISDVQPELCLHCGNCTRCPYLAVTLDGDKIPATDPSRCVGCSICAAKCFAGALFMRERTPEELELLKEA